MRSNIVKIQEDWMTKKWRPMMAMMYMICCVCDFVIFPIMFTGVQFSAQYHTSNSLLQWVPITLNGGGLFHVAMGAVLGVTAYGRTREKVAGVAYTNSNHLNEEANDIGNSDIVCSKDIEKTNANSL